MNDDLRCLLLSALQSRDEYLVDIDSHDPLGLSKDLLDKSQGHKQKAWHSITSTIPHSMTRQIPANAPELCELQFKKNAELEIKST
jgi:hypothetical protein